MIAAEPLAPALAADCAGKMPALLDWGYGGVFAFAAALNVLSWLAFRCGICLFYVLVAHKSSHFALVRATHS